MNPEKPSTVKSQTFTRKAAERSRAGASPHAARCAGSTPVRASSARMASSSRRSTRLEPSGQSVLPDARTRGAEQLKEAGLAEEVQVLRVSVLRVVVVVAG